MEDVPEHIEKHGLSGIEEFFKAKLERWKDVAINIGITGDCGVGKSSFINAIRGLADDDELAAPTGIKATTKETKFYAHPTNKKILFWDLPGIGTPDNPTLETYCENVEFKKYDTFLIFAAERFTEHGVRLAEKVKSLNKTFFFIRTHIDENCRRESRKKAFDEESMLNDIRGNSLKHLKRFGAGDKDVFLISNHETAKWDFARLTQAILDVLPDRQKESRTLSLDLLRSRSKDILKRKVEILKGRIWMVAALSGAGALVPLPGLSVAVDLALLSNEVKLYISQLGLPNENSDDFEGMSSEVKERYGKYFFTSAVQVANLFAAYATSTAVEESTRFIPILGSAIAGGISCSSTYYFLNKCLNEIAEIALEYLDEITRVADDLEDSN